MTVTGPSITVNPWRRGLAGARRRGAWISRGARGGRHCEKDGPRWRPRKWDPRSSQSAPIPSRLVARVSVIDPHHPLFGQRLDLSSHASGRRPGWVSLVLADGRRRWVPRAATDLDSGRESSSSSCSTAGVGAHAASVDAIRPDAALEPTEGFRWLAAQLRSARRSSRSFRTSRRRWCRECGRR